MRFNWLVVVMVMSTFVLGAEYDSLRTEKRGDKWVVIHQVDQGETLYGIARRYKAEVSKVIEQNGIENNAIRSGQLLEIPIRTARKPEPKEENPSTLNEPTNSSHVVQAGETLFAIGGKYGVSADQIMKWNGMTNPSLAIGQTLSIGKAANASPTEQPKDAEEALVPFKGALKHYIQLGESLEQIATRRNVSTDSLKDWNKLQNNDLKIGQILWYRLYDRSVEPETTKEIFGKHVVEGIAMQINDTEDTDKYLALHKELPTGTLLEIRNLMNNKKVYVRIVGQLPSTGVNQDVLIRLTPISFKRLGILDARARVELSYYDQ